MNITRRTSFLLRLATFGVVFLGGTVLACDVPVTAICDGGSDPDEIRWKIKDPTGNVLVSGEGGCESHSNLKIILNYTPLKSYVSDYIIFLYFYLPCGHCGTVHHVHQNRHDSANTVFELGLQVLLSAGLVFDA